METLQSNNYKDQPLIVDHGPSAFIPFTIDDFIREQKFQMDLLHSFDMTFQWTPVKSTIKYTKK